MTFPKSKQPVMRIPSENLQGSFLKIGLPSMEQLRPIYGRLLMLAAMQTIEEMAKRTLGEVTVVWLHKTAAIQIHEAADDQKQAMHRIERFYDALSDGLQIDMKGTSVEMHWSNLPPMAVLEQSSDFSLSQRFIRTGDMLAAMQKYGAAGRDRKRRILMSSEFQTPGDRLRDQTNDWRRQQALQDALVNQGLRLVFREIRATATDTLVGYTAIPQPLVVPGSEKGAPPIDSQQMWALAHRTGAKDELALTLLRLSLNQLRIWNVLIPGNDISVTISVEADCVIQNQERLSQMLKGYADVSDRLIIALKLTDDSIAFKEQELLSATLSDLNQWNGVRFALTNMEFTQGKLKAAQTLNVQATHLSAQWPEASGFYAKAKPIIRNLVRALHKLRSEVVAPNIRPDKTSAKTLADLGIDAYELRPALGCGELTEDEAIMKIKEHQQTIANTVINAQFRFRQAT